MTTQELKKLLGEATPGPWRTVGDKSPNMTGVHAGPSDSGDSYLLFTLINDPDDDGPMGEGGLLPETVAQWKADAALIVAAVNALPELIERVARLEGALDQSADGFEQIADHYGRLIADMPEASMRNSAECIARYQVYTPEFKSMADSYRENALDALKGADDAR